MFGKWKDFYGVQVINEGGFVCLRILDVQVSVEIKEFVRENLIRECMLVIYIVFIYLFSVDILLYIRYQRYIISFYFCKF